MGKKLLFLLFLSLLNFNSFKALGQCTGPTSNTSANITLQGNSTICSDENVSFTSTLNLDGATNPSYQWQVKIGSGAWTDISGANSSSLSNYNAQNNSKFQLELIFCSGTTEETSILSNTSGTITVNQVSTASAIISANKTSICPGESINFTASVTNQGSAPTYSWLVNGTQRGSSSSFTWDQFNNGENVQLLLTSNKACAVDGDADANNIVESNNLNISVKSAIPDQPSPISGSSQVCSNTSGFVYTIPAVDRATSYQWTLPSGWSGTSNTESITVTSGAVGDNKIIKVIALNECGESTERTLSINVGPGKPAKPSAISNPGLICPGESLTLSVTNDTGVNAYTWSVPTGWSITTGNNTNQITVTAGNFGQNGTVSVYSSNDCLDSDLQSISLTINEPAPVNPGAISGNTLVCPDTENSYSISAVNYADSYIWYLDGSELTGENGTSVNFNSGSTGTRNLKVIAVNECVDPANYSSISGSTQSITVDDGTPGTLAISQQNGDDQFCPGETGIIFSVPNTDARIDTYSWQVPSGWNITAGNSTNQITVTTGNLGDDGQITFTGASNTCGSVTATYNVSVKPPAPVIPSGTVIAGKTTVCQDETGISYSVPAIQNAQVYSWTLPANWSITNGGGTNQITINAATTDGTITVAISNDCSGSPETLSLNVTSIDSAPAAPGQISSTAAFMSDPKICPPLNGLQFSVPFVSDDISYTWTLPTGWSIAGESTTNQIVVNVSATQNYNPTETISVVAQNECYTSASTTSFTMDINDFILTALGDDQNVCSTQNQITIPGEIRFGSSKKFNPTYSAVNGNEQNVSANITGKPTNFNNYPNTFNITYNATAADRASGFVKVSVSVPKPSTSGNNPEACGTGYDEMYIYFLADPSAAISATPEICTGQTAEITFNATPNTTITYKIGSGANQSIQIDESGVAMVSTPNLNTDTVISLLNVQYTTAPGCTKNLSESFTVIVNPVPSVDISYANQCSSETASVTVTSENGIGNWQNGTFSATGDLGTKINTTDGSFIPANINPGTYTVTYKIDPNGGCDEVKVTTEATIFEKIQITSQPLEAIVCENGDVQFQVAATGEGLSYQWYKNTVASGNEVGDSSATLNLTGISTADAGNYLVVVSGTAPCTDITSDLASLTVNQNININTQPESVVACEGESINLSVAATTGGVALSSEFTYQWFKGTPGAGTSITGANSATLPLNTVSAPDDGDYYVEITGPATYTCEKIVSNPATVSVRPIPVVSISGNTEICDGSNADIFFTEGTPNVVVTYSLNNDNTNQQSIVLDAAGEAILNTGALNVTSNSTTDFIYNLISVAYVDNPNCSTSITGSTTITVTPNPEVTISFNGNQTEFCTADNTLYTPTLSGTGNYSGGVFSATGITVNATTGAFTPGNEGADTYTLIYEIPASGGCPENSTSLEITIYEEVTITSQPSNLGICSTNDAEFSVSATGDDLSYQWFKDNNPITGAQSATLSLPVATSEDAGEYYVEISGTAACTPSDVSIIQSDVVTLNVDEDIVIIEPAEDVEVCETGDSTVEFKFVAHANGAPLNFVWVYANGTAVDISGNSNYSSTVTEINDYPGLDFTVYEGTLTISNITEADQASYAVKIDGTQNNFICPVATSNSFNLDVNPLPNAPIISNVEYCLGEEAVALTAEGANLTWYDANGNILESAPIPSTNTTSSTSYFVTQKDTFCESPQAEIVVNVYALPNIPPLTAEELNLDYCLGETAVALTATADTDATITWYNSETADTPLDGPPTPQTTAPGDLFFWVSQTNLNNCEGDRAKITVSINALPVITASEDQTICAGDSFTLTASDGTNTSTTFDWESNFGETFSGSSVSVSPSETTTYTVTATNEKGCVNTEEILINVDTPPLGGTIDGPSSICINNNNGVLNLLDHSGTIVQWEYKPQTATDWVSINEATPDASYTFTNLTEATSFRVLVSNGVCEDVYSTEALIKVDQVPIGGELNFGSSGRIFLICENADPGYAVPLDLTGSNGTIVAWRYRGETDTQWSTITQNGTNFTGSSISATNIESFVNNQTTVFRVELASENGACVPNAFSQTAILSVIPTNIQPAPVKVDPKYLCFGETITLSSSTGYGSEFGEFEGGAFDNSSITNKGWRITDENGNSDYNFDSSADNRRPDKWLRTTPHDFATADTNTNAITDQRWDSFIGTEGNKGFAIVSGDNPSTLETPVFALNGLDEAILTFDQAYNLTAGATIQVEISTDGGATYSSQPLLLFRSGPASSGNYDRFNEGTPETRPNNKIEIDLGNYIGRSNLRIRFKFDGVRDGDIWAVDNIKVPDGPQDVQLIWYYDENLDDPNNTLEQIGEVNQGMVQFTPRKIGWNDFEVQTALLFDTNGDPCESAINSKTISVYVFDSYQSIATAVVGSCGNTDVLLSGKITAVIQEGEILEFPDGDGSVAAWEVIEAPSGYTFSTDHFINDDTSISAINDANAIFQPTIAGSYTLRWTITPNSTPGENEDFPANPCPINHTDVQFEFLECTTLDFDGLDDYVKINDNYSAAKTIEVWVRPEAENGPGNGKTATVFSSDNVELYLNSSSRPVLKYYGKTLTSSKSLQLDNRWYHLAVNFDAGSAKMFIDGLEIKDASTGSSGSGSGSTSFLVGASFTAENQLPDNYFSGWIEELRIWNTSLSEAQIRFMMNQHLQNTANIGVEIPMPVPGGLTYNNLLGYYRLISEIPDPLGAASPITFDNALKPLNGNTPDLATNSIPGRLHNMTTHQQNTAPLPYLSNTDGEWTNINTWLRPTVWDIPNANGVTGDPIDWNIVRTFHNITSDAKDITVLGLKSETLDKEITMAAPAGPMDETNNGQIMRVTHYLLLDGNMDLVGESQLLQDQGSILDEASAGWLERDQQGTQSSFNYNYWTSPVSAQGAANNAPYSVGQVLLDGTTSSSPEGIRFDGRYAAADAARTNPITISEFWIWKFKGTADIYGEWFHVGSTESLQTGEGYSMKGSTGPAAISARQNYTFKGKPHNGDFTRNIGTDQNYLIGNPYPSAIDANEFIKDNLNSSVVSGATNSRNIFNGVLYFWDHFSGYTHILEEYIGGYAALTLAGGAPAISNDSRINDNDAVGVKEPQRFVPVGQGFFVLTGVDSDNDESVNVQGGDIVFKNSQRVAVRESNSTSLFLKPEYPTKSAKEPTETRAKIRVKFKSPKGYHRQILVTRDPITTNGFDIGYDAPLIDYNVEDMYWLIEDKEFVIQAVPHFDKEQVLPIGIRIDEEGSFKIQIDSVENWTSDKPVYLHDKLRDSVHSILGKPYEEYSEAVGEITDRFELIFFKEVLEEVPPVVDVPEIDEEEVEGLPIIDDLLGIGYSHFTKSIKLYNPDLLKINKVILFDIGGKQVQDFINIPNIEENSLPIRPVRSGVYIVKVLCEKGVCNKKIIIR